MVRYQTIILETMKYLRSHLEREQSSVSIISNYKMLILTAIGLLLANASFAQRATPDSIYYFLPNVVKLKISEHNKSIKSKHTIYGVLSNHNDTTQLIISNYRDSPQELIWLIKNSNRYLKLDITECIPLVLREDYLFSTLLHSVKNEDDPYAVFKHKLISVSGYLICFQGLYEKARIISAKYYQQ